MLELGIGADLVRGIGLVLWGLLAAALLVALFKPKTITGKVLSSLLVLGIFFGPMVPGAIAAHEYRQKYEKAKALFDERCKTAGEKIYKTVENVEGILLMKVRPERINFSDQYALDDPYGRDVGGEGYIGSFLRSVSGNELNTRVAAGRQAGFKWVEVADSTNNQIYRYQGVIKSVEGRDPNFVLEKTVVAKSVAQFGITYDDISTKEDRDNWIAGGTIRVIDTKTNVVLAERVGYMFDRGLGSTSGQRSPWAFARDNACPGFRLTPDGRATLHYVTSPFSLKVLKPI